jgi:hypothetical protein
VDDWAEPLLGNWVGRHASSYHEGLVGSVFDVLWWLAPAAEQWLDWDWRARVLQLTLLVGVGLGIYLAAQVALGTRIRDFSAPKQR